MSKHSLWFPRNEFKTGLTGALELACFLEQGVNRFPNSVEAAMRSFWLVLLGFSLNCSAMILLYGQFEKLRRAPLLTLIMNDALRVVFVNLCMILGLYAICTVSRRTENFARLICGLNWLQIITLIALAPLHLLVWAGINGIKDAATLEWIYFTYFSVVSAFFISRCIPVRWVVAAYIVVLTYMIDQTSLMMMVG